MYFTEDRFTVRLLRFLQYPCWRSNIGIWTVSSIFNNPRLFPRLLWIFKCLQLFAFCSFSRTQARPRYLCIFFFLVFIYFTLWSTGTVRLLVNKFFFFFLPKTWSGLLFWIRGCFHQEISENFVNLVLPNRF